MKLYAGIDCGSVSINAVVIDGTGKILREEPRLSYDLRADPRWGDALVEWRERHWELCEPPWLLILTGRGDIDKESPERTMAKAAAFGGVVGPRGARPSVMGGMPFRGPAAFLPLSRM